MILLSAHSNRSWHLRTSILQLLLQLKTRGILAVWKSRNYFRMSLLQANLTHTWVRKTWRVLRKLTLRLPCLANLATNVEVPRKKKLRPNLTTKKNTYTNLNSQHRLTLSCSKMGTHLKLAHPLFTGLTAAQDSNRKWSTNLRTNWLWRDKNGRICNPKWALWNANWKRLKS